MATEEELNVGASPLSENMGFNNSGLPMNNEGASPLSEMNTPMNNMGASPLSEMNTPMNNMDASPPSNMNSPMNNEGASPLSENLSAIPEEEEEESPSPALQPAMAFSPKRSSEPPSSNTGPPPPSNTGPPPPSPPPANAGPPPPSPPPANAPIEIPKDRKKTRSKKQAEADEGQRQMLETLRGRYASEFANIPEKFRPKPKAYVARAAYYKEPGKERDNYINSWIQTDRDVAEARMGINVMNKYEKQQNQYAPPSAIVSRTHLGTANLEATAKPLRIQAEKSEKKLLHVAERAEESILKRAKDPATRVAARSITSEVKRQAKALTSEANRQANALEKAAKEQIKIESQKAFAELEAKAKENLTVARAGVKPNKILTRRLARMRNQGHGITAESFLKEEKAKGRYESPKKRGRKTYKKKNNSNSNSGIPLNSFAESR